MYEVLHDLLLEESKNILRRIKNEPLNKYIYKQQNNERKFRKMI